MKAQITLGFVAVLLYGFAAWFNPQEPVGAWLHETANEVQENMPHVPFSGLFNF